MAAPDTPEDTIIATMLDKIAGLDPRRTPDMIALGGALLDIQSALPARAFEPWRREHLPGLGRRSVLNFMQAARRFGPNPDAVAHLSPTAVVRLSAKSVPEAEREALIDRASSGGNLVAADIVVQAREARDRDATKADAAARSRDRKATVRAWQREHGRDASSDEIRLAATRRAALSLARADAPPWLRNTVGACDPHELKAAILAAWAERAFEAEIAGSTPTPLQAKPASSPGLRLVKAQNPRRVRPGAE